MGYEVHISKTQNWLDSDKHPITNEALAQLISLHPEFSFKEDGPVKYLDDLVFTFDGSKISIKSPTDAQLYFAFKLSQELNAFLVGDDQEIYTFKKKYFGLFGPTILKYKINKYKE